MSDPDESRYAEFYAQTYDDWVPDWPGEFDFYRQMATEAARRGAAVLEVACGTGRIAARLAREGIPVVGLDLSAEMLRVASRKTLGLDKVRWVEGDMRSFDLGQSFALAIIPGHSFQHLNTPSDQIACLQCIRRHLQPEGLLVVHLDHQDLAWLGALPREESSQMQPAGEFRHLFTGRTIRMLKAWSYEPASQTAISQRIFEEVGAEGEVLQRWERSPVRLHCVFRFEMEHLLARAGFEIDSVLGDFFRGSLLDTSSEMIWLAHKGQG